MKINQIILLTFLFISIEINAQQAYTGSFLLTFQSSSQDNNDFPMLWNIEPAKEGGHMAMEIQDDMIKKGVSKRVLFDMKDSTWTMLMEFNKVKQGSRIHAADMFREKKKSKINIEAHSTNIKKLIDGYNCNKIIIDTDKYHSEIWVTDKIDFNLGKIYLLLSHCGMMNEYVRKGDWFLFETKKQMILEVTSKSKLTGDAYTLQITDIHPKEINPHFFETNGFRISDIPEGQNCGVVVDDK